MIVLRRFRGGCGSGHGGSCGGNEMKFHESDHVRENFHENGRVEMRKFQLD